MSPETALLHAERERYLAKRREEFLAAQARLRAMGEEALRLERAYADEPQDRERLYTRACCNCGQWFRQRHARGRPKLYCAACRR